MTSYLSDTRIRSETQKWADKVYQLTSKIDNKNQLLKQLKSDINSINLTITNDDYIDCRNKYADYTNEINKLTLEHNKSKSKATESQLSSQINDLKSKKSSCANKMRLIANNQGFINEFIDIIEKTRNASLISNLIYDLKQQRSAAQKQWDYWHKQTII